MSAGEAKMLTLPISFSLNVENHDWNSVISCVKEITKEIRPDGAYVTSDDLNKIEHTLHEALADFRDKNSADALLAITELFRFLRNACAINKLIQKNLGNTAVFGCTSDILDILCEDSISQNNIVCLKVIIQFLGNAIVENNTNLTIVWDLLHPHLKELLKCSDDHLANFTCMVLYNILIGKSDAALKFITSNASLVLQCYSSGSEFATFVVEYILGKENFLEEIYPLLEVENRIIVLNAIWTLLINQESDAEKNNFPLSNLLYLVSELKHRADCVLTIVEKGVTPEPRETLRLLDVVASASSHSQYIASLQADCSLLISAACLLKSVHDIGESEEANVFSRVQRLCDIKSSDQGIQDHPVFGFKVSLIRLIGNLCHQHTGNQNQVRELGCLPAVLNTCNIDVYNPLLLQWGILAVRNLLENNGTNQQIIAGLVAQGPTSNAVLKELGLELHQGEHGSLHIAPLKRT